MLKITPKIKIDPDQVRILREKGIEIPTCAEIYNHIRVDNPANSVDIYTFKDRYNLSLRQIKTDIVNATQKKTTQVRDYEYDRGPAYIGKLSAVHQKVYDSEGVEQACTNWRFYHPKDSKIVRFARKGVGGDKNNYLQADGFITDSNGLRIRPISTAEYVNEMRDLEKSQVVDYPWTPKESITTRGKCATDSVQECTVVGIYGEKGLSLNHFNPNNPENIPAVITDKLMDDLEQQGRNAKAFVIGACDCDYKSREQFNNIIDFLKAKEVNYSSFKTGDNVLFGDFDYYTRFGLSGNRKYQNGEVSPFEWQPGQHILYENGEIRLANPVIDKELKKGNTNPDDLIQKSFTRIKK